MRKIFCWFIPLAMLLFGCFPVSDVVSDEDFDITTLSFPNSNLKVYISPTSQQSSSILYSTTPATQTDTTIALSYSPANALNKHITWSISNTDVVSFADEGTFQRKISVKNVGSSQITATATTLKETTLQTSLAVNCYYIIQGFSIDTADIPSGVSIRENQTYQLKTNFSPTDNIDTEVNWSSNKNSVATVSSNGLITGVAYGEAYISATPIGKAVSNFKDSVLVSVDYATGSKINFLNDNVELQMHYVPQMTSFPASSGTESVEQSYWMAETETTKKLWDSVTTWATSNGYTFSSDPTAPSAEYPIGNVSWGEAIIFCNALTEYCNSKMGTSYSPYYLNGSQTIKNATFSSVNLSSTKNGYRLPTGAEWRLAAMYIQDKSYDKTLLPNNNEATDLNWASGASSSSGFSTVAWYGEGESGSSHEVKKKKGNALEIYDMNGNLWEWYYTNGVLDENRMRAGGSYLSTSVSIVFQDNSDYYTKSPAFGFRVVKNKD